MTNNDLIFLKAHLSDLPQIYNGILTKLLKIHMHKEHFQMIKFLCNNQHILIIKLDQGSDVMILNFSDYIQKLNDILNDDSKFHRLDDIENFDKTAQLEQKKKYLLELSKWGALCVW